MQPGELIAERFRLEAPIGAGAMGVVYRARDEAASGRWVAVKLLRQEGSTRSERFVREADASMVAVNTSTRFNDGGQLGLGAEIGISTSKLHAFGPMGVDELTAKKFVVMGNGQVRS